MGPLDPPLPFPSLPCLCSGLLNPVTSDYLDDWVPSLQQCDGQQYALLEDPVTGSVHDEVDDEVRGSFLVQVALDLGQTQLPPTPDARTNNWSKKWSEINYKFTLILGGVFSFGYDEITKKRSEMSLNDNRAKGHPENMTCAFLLLNIKMNT